MSKMLLLSGGEVEQGPDEHSEWSIHFPKRGPKPRFAGLSVMERAGILSWGLDWETNICHVSFDRKLQFQIGDEILTVMTIDDRSPKRWTVDRVKPCTARGEHHIWVHSKT